MALTDCGVRVARTSAASCRGDPAAYAVPDRVTVSIALCLYRTPTGARLFAYCPPHTRRTAAETGRHVTPANAAGRTSCALAYAMAAFKRGRSFQAAPPAITRNPT